MEFHLKTNEHFSFISAVTDLEKILVCGGLSEMKGIVSS